MSIDNNSDELPKIGNPARRALAERGVTLLSQVAQMTKDELQQLHGVGPKAIGILEQVLRDKGLSLKEAKP